MSIQKIESINNILNDLEFELEALHEMDNAELSEIEAVESEIIDYQEELKELRKDVFPTTVRINVRKKHIKEGVAVSCSRCPIALAIRQAFTKAGIPLRPKTGVSTAPNIADVRHANDLELAATYVPRRDVDKHRMNDFIEAFDRGHHVEVVSFTMRKVR